MDNTHTHIFFSIHSPIYNATLTVWRETQRHKFSVYCLQAVRINCLETAESPSQGMSFTGMDNFMADIRRCFPWGNEPGSQNERRRI